MTARRATQFSHLKAGQVVAIYCGGRESRVRGGRIESFDVGRRGEVHRAICEGENPTIIYSDDFTDDASIIWILEEAPVKPITLSRDAQNQLVWLETELKMITPKNTNLDVAARRLVEEIRKTNPL